MSKKTIIKCDRCGKTLNREKDKKYYEITLCYLPGWSAIDYSCGENTHWQICKECFNVLKSDE